ncbi:telomeric repeat binding factor a isoform X2 [Cheilinus undulatus]|uniref:telomeric repeat binding factor a isoform X2 n=1 Tax=Cheilinus undulatus TaxID=241271 RepID=UPI001BD3FE65|nr:telomeric repeat binding factor a isoform X2 [Cheilinus undulatus]
MAAKETVKSPQKEVEAIVNRWLVEYYYSCLIELFKKDQYDDFCGVRCIVEGVLARPLQTTDVMPTKLRILQFLSRINEGEKLDLMFDTDQSATPLESALAILEVMNEENIVSTQDFKKVSTSLKEMIVGILIKNEEFDKAKEVLTNHFPKKMVGKKAIFTGLIRQKSKTHEVIEKLDYKQFRGEMVAFCERLCPTSVPFLQQAANRLVNERKEKEDDKASSITEQDEPGPSSPHPTNIIELVPCKHTIILKTRLEAAYLALSVGSDERTFAQLEEEVQRETNSECLSLNPSCSPERSSSQDSEQNQLFQRDSGSPMEGSPADQPPQVDSLSQPPAGSLSKTPEVTRNRRLPYNLARLVVEPDSQGSSQSTSALQDLQVELRTEEPSQSAASSNQENGNRASTSLAESSAEIVDYSPDEVHDRANRSQHSHSKTFKRISSDLEEEDIQDLSSPFKTPHKGPARDPQSKDQGKGSVIHIADTSLDSSPSLFPLHPIPQTSSTPQRDEGPASKKWKKLYHNAKESKETWSDEESYFNTKTKSKPQDVSTVSSSGQRKRMWTDVETQKLREGVKKFGEGNWSKIKDYFGFKERTNVQLKDRWRTMKKLHMV